MRVLIDSYNNVMQNKSGGIQVRIENYISNLEKYCEIKLFNKWEDKVENYEILHIFKANIESVALVRLAKKKGVKIVLSSVIPQEKKQIIRINRLIHKILPIHTGYYFIEEILKLSDIVLAQTEKEKKFISENYKIKLDKIEVIPNGINIKLQGISENLFREKYKIKRKFVLQVGRFDENKNQLTVIKALKNLNIPVVFIGGPEESSLKYYKECKKEANENFKFLGWISHDDVMLASAYKAAHIVILPSHKEIFGNSLIEGGASGAKLIATKELPISDWEISEFCETVNPKSLKDIKIKVLKLINESKNEGTKQIINKKFSWKEVAKRHYEIYKRIKRL